jgi:hypothetical protein
VEQGLSDLYNWAKVPIYKGIWVPEQLNTLDTEFMQRAFAEDPELFLIIQSNLEVPLDSLILLFSASLQAAPEDDPLHDGMTQRISRLVRRFMRKNR